jgi:hypothetical protein
MPMMRLTADFLIRMEAQRRLAANDNRFGDGNIFVGKFVPPEIIRICAKFMRDGGAP